MSGTQPALSSNPFASFAAADASNAASPFTSNPKGSETASSSNPFAKPSASGNNNNLFSQSSFDPWSQKAESSSLVWGSAAASKRNTEAENTGSGNSSDPWASWMKDNPKKDDRENSWGNWNKDNQKKWGENSSAGWKNNSASSWKGDNSSAGWKNNSASTWKGDKKWSSSWSNNWSNSWSKDTGNQEEAGVQESEAGKKVTLSARSHGHEGAWQDDGRQDCETGEKESTRENNAQPSPASPPLSVVSSKEAVGEEGEEEHDWGEEGEEEDDDPDDDDHDDDDDDDDEAARSGAKVLDAPIAAAQSVGPLDRPLDSNTIDLDASEEEHDDALDVGGSSFTYAYDKDAITAAKELCAFLTAPDSLGAPICKIEGKGVIGQLDTICSEKEMKERSEQRQLDALEWADGSTPQRPFLNPNAACKKYQRSAADRVYHPEDIRTLPALAKCLFYLLADVISTDEKHGRVDFWQVYSFLRDRTRAVRVDLHLQQPWSTMTRVYIVAHEVCLRFEILSMYLLCSKEEYRKKYDEKMAHKACAQVMEPLLNAYQQVRSSRDSKGAYISPAEPAIRRYAILLLFVGGEESKVFEHLSKTPKDLLTHPAIQWAIEVTSSFAIGNYSRFLRLYYEGDFLSATILSPFTNLARQRLLWLLVRSNVPMRRDKLPLEDLRRRLALWDTRITEQFLRFHGLEIIELGTGSKLVQLPSRTQGSWDVMHDGISQASFNKHLGTNAKPIRCEFERKHDGNLRAKYAALDCSRSNIVFGAIDPLNGVTGMSAKEGPRSSPSIVDCISPKAKAMPRAPLAARESQTQIPCPIVATPDSTQPLAVTELDAGPNLSGNLFAIGVPSSETKAAVSDKTVSIFATPKEGTLFLVLKPASTSIFASALDKDDPETSKKSTAFVFGMGSPPKQQSDEVDDASGLLAQAGQKSDQSGHSSLKVSFSSDSTDNLVPSRNDIVSALEKSPRDAKQTGIEKMVPPSPQVDQSAIDSAKNPAVQALFADVGRASASSPKFAAGETSLAESTSSKSPLLVLQRNRDAFIDPGARDFSVDLHVAESSLSPFEKKLASASLEVCTERMVYLFRMAHLFAAWHKASRATGGWSSWAKGASRTRQGIDRPLHSAAASHHWADKSAPSRKNIASVSEAKLAESALSKSPLFAFQRTREAMLDPGANEFSQELHGEGTDMLPLETKLASASLSTCTDRMVYLFRMAHFFAAWHKASRATGAWTSWVKASSTKRQRIAPPSHSTVASSVGPNYIKDATEVVWAASPTRLDLPVRKRKHWSVAGDTVSEQTDLRTRISFQAPPMLPALMGRLPSSSDVQPLPARRIIDKEAPTREEAVTRTKRKEPLPSIPQHDITLSTVQREPVSRKRSKSFLDVLQKDAAWTESLLRGVALLASDVPV